MTIPGVGAVVAMTFRSAVDQPERFARSKAVGAYFGLTPKKYQSGEIDRTGRISKVGDAMVRTALFEAANVMLTRLPALEAWALRVASRQGMKKAKVALARKPCRGGAPHVAGRHGVSQGQASHAGGRSLSFTEPAGGGHVAGTHGSDEAANPGVAGSPGPDHAS
jgi:Transposase IS116/IS110/IS902 family